MKEQVYQWLILHRRGVMGTVIFHLLLAICFLGVSISQADVHYEIEIVMEVPDEEEVRQQREEEQRQEDIRRQASGEEVERMLRSIAVNENVERAEHPMERVEDYIDEIRKELETAAGNDGRYVARRDEHYQKDSLQWAHGKEEQALDSLKSVFYVGESSVSYDLEGRYARILPIPVFKCESGGKVVVTVVVNPQGVVMQAEVVPSLSEDNEILWRVAKDAANRSRFNEKPDAPSRQKGTITYHFVPQ